MRWSCLLGVLALYGCSSTKSETDASIPTDGPGHTLGQLKVEGKVTLSTGTPGTGVKVIGRCGDKVAQVVTDDQGSYVLQSDVKDCTPLVIEFNKESFLPNYRVLHLPPPTSPVTLDVPLSELSEIQCGSYRCLLENDTRWSMPNHPMRQGWAVGMAGTSALDFVGGEFRQDDGSIVTLVGFVYFDFRDQTGAHLDTFKSEDVFELCMPVPTEALDWLGDIDLDTDVVEMSWYTMDPTKGRWHPHGELAIAAYTAGFKIQDNNGMCETVTDPEGNMIRNIVELKRDQLPDVRADQLMYIDGCTGQSLKASEFWICGSILGSGWFAYGLGVKERTCFSLLAKDQCGTLLPNVVFVLKGRDHGFRATTWTDNDGRGCLEVIPSEPTGQDYDFDELGGETFWVDVSLNLAIAAQQQLFAHENPKYQDASKSCDQPASCTPLEQEFQDYSKVDCSN